MARRASLNVGLHDTERASESPHAEASVAIPGHLHESLEHSDSHLKHLHRSQQGASAELVRVSRVHLISPYVAHLFFIVFHAHGD